MNDDRVFEVRINRKHADLAEAAMAKWHGPTIVDLIFDELQALNDTIEFDEELELTVKEIIGDETT